ncbi:hypothetical protein ACIQGO_03125 [Streptomyces shenzhenensis]|uniref:hypothetical protein n=1 Tax=Streptomyces shenzhenensis TaxID=943815 RepID=UPI0037F28291
MTRNFAGTNFSFCGVDLATGSRVTLKSTVSPCSRVIFTGFLEDRASDQVPSVF